MNSLLVLDSSPATAGMTVPLGQLPLGGLQAGATACGSPSQPHLKGGWSTQHMEPQLPLVHTDHTDCLLLQDSFPAPTLKLSARLIVEHLVAQYGQCDDKGSIHPRLNGDEVL